MVKVKVKSDLMIRDFRKCNVSTLKKRGLSEKPASYIPIYSYNYGPKNIPAKHTSATSKKSGFLSPAPLKIDGVHTGIATGRGSASQLIWVSRNGCPHQKPLQVISYSPVSSFCIGTSGFSAPRNCGFPHLHMSFGYLHAIM